MGAQEEKPTKEQRIEGLKTEFAAAQKYIAEEVPNAAIDEIVDVYQKIIDVHEAIAVERIGRTQKNPLRHWRDRAMIGRAAGEQISTHKDYDERYLPVVNYCYGIALAAEEAINTYILNAQPSQNFSAGDSLS